MKHDISLLVVPCNLLSVLSVEPYGMKPGEFEMTTFKIHPLSVLSVEPYGMKQSHRAGSFGYCRTFSALGRAVWDETSLSGNISR